MKRIVSALTGALLATSLAACATTGMSYAETLALYRAHAAPPVNSFQFLGHIDGWTPLGDSAVAVWTRPTQAYLLELYGPCQDLQFTPVIGVTSQFSRVSAKFDKVLVRSRTAINLPCQIETIRPLDVKAIRAAEKHAREQMSQAREASDSQSLGSQPSGSAPSSN